MRPVILLLPALFACKKVEPAPTELDELLHWFFDNFEDGDDELLAEGQRNLHDVIDGDGLDEPVDGSFSGLSQEQVDREGRDDADADKTVGMYTTGTISCDRSGMDAILAHEHQDELFPDIYDSYSRDYQTSKSDYLAGGAAVAEWDSHYTTSAIGTDFSADLDEWLRRVPDIDDEITPHGAFLILKRVMPAPADFGDSGKSFPQDYKAEVYYERKGGDVVHAHAMWRQADFGAGLDQDNESVQRLLLNGMHDWDDTAGENCAAGKP